MEFEIRQDRHRKALADARAGGVLPAHDAGLQQPGSLSDRRDQRSNWQEVAKRLAFVSVGKPKPRIYVEVSAPGLSRYLREDDRIHIADRLREKATIRQIALSWVAARPR
ncbi:hypothetical protein [Nocardia amikacinitolerans]|uniref:hypothetical protein n=1 Tax=Nocardia amikacinitolerans TaxID=756689 RepID=UPI0020A5DB9C|nr:hypothetical protein [Nocardia amikacinitolerans]